LGIAGMGIAEGGDFYVLPSLVPKGQPAGGYYYDTYRYGYNPGYYTRRYSGPSAITFQHAKAIAPGVLYVYRVLPSAAGQGGSPQPLRVVVGLAESGTPAEASARLDLTVPEGAEVWFDGAKNTRTGSLRRFVTPPLKAGRKYTYEVRVAWKNGGDEVTETRPLSVGAGENLSALFSTATANAGTGASGRPTLPPGAGN
jgi:uncharacterized protein (TIGR03000 family)